MVLRLPLLISRVLRVTHTHSQDIPHNLKSIRVGTSPALYRKKNIRDLKYKYAIVHIKYIHINPLAKLLKLLLIANVYCFYPTLHFQKIVRCVNRPLRKDTTPSDARSQFRVLFSFEKDEFVAWRFATIFASLVMSSVDFSFYETKQTTLESYAKNFFRNVCRRFNRRRFRVSIHGMLIDASGVSHPESWERRVLCARRMSYAHTIYIIFVARTMSMRREKKTTIIRRDKCRERVEIGQSYSRNKRETCHKNFYRQPFLKILAKNLSLIRSRNNDRYSPGVALIVAISWHLCDP